MRVISARVCLRENPDGDLYSSIAHILRVVSQERVSFIEGFDG